MDTKTALKRGKFTVKMHEIRFRLGFWGSVPDRGGTLQRSPDFLAVFWGPTSKENRSEKGEETGRREREGKRKGKRWATIPRF